MERISEYVIKCWYLNDTSATGKCLKKLRSESYSTPIYSLQFIFIDSNVSPNLILVYFSPSLRQNAKFVYFFGIQSSLVSFAATAFVLRANINDHSSVHVGRKISATRLNSQLP